LITAADLGIAIEEHCNSAGIRDALDRLPDRAYNESVAGNTAGDNQSRPDDIGRAVSRRGTPLDRGFDPVPPWLRRSQPG
jgi:hypothetical protein